MSEAPRPAEGAGGGRGAVVWLTGLPSSGKSTLARRLQGRLGSAGCATVVLDSDDVRAALVPPPGYTPEARADFYATLARLSALLAGQGLVVLVPATAHLCAYRDAARARAPRFVEVWVRASAEECARRDAKGLYAAARAGRARGLPGADLVYEPPLAAEVTADGGHDQAAVEAVARRVLER